MFSRAGFPAGRLGRLLGFVYQLDDLFPVVQEADIREGTLEELEVYMLAG